MPGFFFRGCHLPMRPNLVLGHVAAGIFFFAVAVDDDCAGNGLNPLLQLRS